MSSCCLPAEPGQGDENGMVQIYFSSSDRATGSTALLHADDANVTIFGQDEFSWFGQHSVVVEVRRLMRRAFMILNVHSLSHVGPRSASCCS